MCQRHVIETGLPEPGKRALPVQTQGPEQVFGDGPDILQGILVTKVMSMGARRPLMPDHLPGVGRQQAAQHFDEGGFTAPIGPCQVNALARLQRK